VGGENLSGEEVVLVGRMGVGVPVGRERFCFLLLLAKNRYTILFVRSTGHLS